MNEQPHTDADATVPPVKAERRERRKAKRRAAPAVAKEPKAKPFAGVTSTKCCDGCTEEKCLISTVNVCKHPFKTGDSGCGPVTLKNREDVKRIVKRQKAEV